MAYQLIFSKTTQMFNSNKITSGQFLVITLLLSLITTTVYAALDFNTMLNALKQNAAPMIRFVVATAYVIGLWYIFSAIKELKTIGQTQMQTSQHGGVGGPLIKFVIGLLLLYLPSTVDIGVWTLWGHSAFGSEAGVMAYTPDITDPFAPAKEGAIAIVRVVGYVSFVRGLVILSHSADQSGGQSGSFGKGIAHVIGGILAINIVETIAIISNTLGINII